MTPFNPWNELTGPRFIAQSDIQAMSHPRLASQLTGSHALRLDIPPEPWCGPIHNASVLALAANPRWNEADDVQYTVEQRSAMIDNLSGFEPLIWFRPNFLGGSGARWYGEARPGLLKEVLAHVPRDVVARKFALVDFFPYRSEKWKETIRVPSQQYTFDAVRAALHRGSLLVITQAEKLWRSAVPEINDALGTQVFINSSWQNKRISANNTRLPDVGRPDKFNAVIEALLQGA